MKILPLLILAPLFSYSQAITWNEPVDLTVNLCSFENEDIDSTQNNIDKAIMEWVMENQNNLDPLGGCSDITVSSDFDNNSIDACSGGSTSITWSLSDTCNSHTTSAKFTLLEANGIIINEPTDLTVELDATDSQSTVDTLFTFWFTDVINQIDLSGGCNPVISNDWDGSIPDLCSGGTIEVTWTIEDLCSKSNVDAVFHLEPLPEARFINAPNDITLDCEDLKNYVIPDLYYTFSPAGVSDSSDFVQGIMMGDFENCESPVSIIWSFTDGCGRSLEHLQNISVIDNNGCDSIIMEISLDAGSFCEGASTTIQAPNNFTTYLWSTGETSNFISVYSSGVYGVTVTDENGCTATASTILESISNPEPVIYLDYGYCDGEASFLNVGPYSSYVWSTGETAPSIQVNDPGTYLVTVTDNNGCSAVAGFYFTDLFLDTIQVFDTTIVQIYDTITVFDTAFIAVTDTLIINLATTGTNDNSDLSAIKIFPNPSNDLIIVDFEEFENFLKYEIIIINELGALSYSKEVEQKTLEIPISDIGPPGSYFIQIFDEVNRLIESKVLILVE